VIAPAAEHAEPANEATIEAAITDALTTLPASKAAAQVAKALGLTKDDVYLRILKRKADGQA
jgi:16S rRNA (cytidine1402-2'-O)-methyltransferase